MALCEIGSIAELITTLGGPKAAGETLGATPQMVVNWRERGSLPSRSYLIHKTKLAERGLSAPPTLWGLSDPAEAAA